ncbi:MAG: hypothetical protein A2X48_05430 [Lentisphaerae bacterium GWF2_49_21]|nr:MAG: hypothetical protein A2X48_05430 [Lentisphaerae bacterium GWF2_49_21]
MTRENRSREKDGPSCRSAVDILDETFHFLRMHGLPLLPYYFIGTAPFVLGLLFFVNDMMNSAYAYEKLGLYSLLAALLYSFKNLMNSVYCRKVLEVLNGKAHQRPEAGTLARSFLIQSIFQPPMLFIQPLAFLFMLPAAWTMAFANNLVVLGCWGNDTVSGTLKKSWRQMINNPVQNHFLLVMIGFLAFAAVLNVAILVLLIPFFMKMFFGLETVFSRAGDPFLILRLVFNLTYWSVVMTAAYMIVDPVLKTAYAVRVFYGESIHAGNDLLAEIAKRSKAGKKLKVAAGFAIMVFLALPAVSVSGEIVPDADIPAPAMRPENMSVKKTELETAVREVLLRREYSWRAPGEEKGAHRKSELESYLEAIFGSIGDWVKNMLDKIAGWFPSGDTPEGDGFSLGAFSRENYLLILSSVCLLSVLFAAMIYFRRRGRRRISPVSVPIAAALPIDIENMTADELAESEWMKIAGEFSGKGDFRTASRAVFMACISALSQKNVLTVAKHKTNREYYYEVKRRYHIRPDAVTAFNENTGLFERIWYGTLRADGETMDYFIRNYDRIRS